MRRLHYLALSIENYIEYLEIELEKQKQMDYEEAKPFDLDIVKQLLFFDNKDILYTTLWKLKNECMSNLSESEIKKMETTINNLLNTNIDDKELMKSVFEKLEKIIKIAREVLDMANYIFIRNEEWDLNA